MGGWLSSHNCFSSYSICSRGISLPLLLAVSVSCSLCIYFKINCSFVAKLLEWGFHFHLQQKTVASGIAIAIGIEQCNPPLLPTGSPPLPMALRLPTLVACPDQARPIAAIACSNKICPRKGGETKGGGEELGKGHARSNQSARLVFAFLFCLFEHCCCRRCRCSLPLPSPLPAANTCHKRQLWHLAYVCNGFSINLSSPVYCRRRHIRLDRSIDNTATAIVKLTRIDHLQQPQLHAIPVR